METVDLLGLLVPVTYFAMLGIERIWPARQFPPIRFWQWIGIGFLLIMAVLSTIVPLLIPASWLDAHRVFDGRWLGVVPGAIVGYIVYSGVAYAYHRCTHSLPWLWRFTHQLHHSAQRVDISGATLFHPIDITLYILLSVATSSLLLGLDPVAAALTGYVAAFYSFFQHWNIRTPRWIGYFIQRPEAHCVHHRRCVHAYNYGDLPIWDILFGTFRNPREYNGEVGFDSPQAAQLGKMLLCEDVNDKQSVSFGLPRAA